MIMMEDEYKPLDMKPNYDSPYSVDINQFIKEEKASISDTHLQGKRFGAVHRIQALVASQSIDAKEFALGRLDRMVTNGIHKDCVDCSARRNLIEEAKIDWSNETEIRMTTTCMHVVCEKANNARKLIFDNLAYMKKMAEAAKKGSYGTW